MGDSVLYIHGFLIESMYFSGFFEAAASFPDALFPARSIISESVHSFTES